jgi:hypothetical protein
MGSKRGGDDEEREDAKELAGTGTRRVYTRAETSDHGAIIKALKEGFEAGGSVARGTVDSQQVALREAYAEIKALRDEIRGLGTKNAELVERLQTVAGQNVTLALSEQQARNRDIDTREKWETWRHALTNVSTMVGPGAAGPLVSLLVETLGPKVRGLLPAEPPPTGKTPRDAAERFARRLLDGSEESKVVLGIVQEYVADTLGPEDGPLVLQFFAETVAAPKAESSKTEASRANPAAKSSEGAPS